MLDSRNIETFSSTLGSAVSMPFAVLTRAKSNGGAQLPSCSSTVVISQLSNLLLRNCHCHAELLDSCSCAVELFYVTIHNSYKPSIMISLLTRF